MSITSALFTGVSGLINNGEAMNVIGNNLSNVNTIGFKGARTLFSDMLSASIGNNSQIGRGMQMQKVDNLFTQSSFETTENVTDLAIQGDSFFALGVPTAAPGAAVVATDAYYTRAGAFRTDNNRYLVNPDNYKVLGGDMVPIRFAATVTVGANTLNFQKVSGIDAQGVIRVLYADAAGNSSVQYYNGNDAVTDTAPGVKIAMGRVDNPGGLEKVGGTLFRSTGTGLGASGNPSITTANGSTEKINSNSLELSNVDMASQFVKMIITQRAYSANSKTITTTDEMMQEALGLKR